MCSRVGCPQVLGTLTPDNMLAAAQRLLPFPCKTRYTAVTMVPRQPNIFQRLLFKFAALSSEAQMAAAGAVGTAVLAAVGSVAWKYYSRN